MCPCCDDLSSFLDEHFSLHEDSNQLKSSILFRTLTLSFESLDFGKFFAYQNFLRLPFANVSISENHIFYGPPYLLTLA